LSSGRFVKSTNVSFLSGSAHDWLDDAVTVTVTDERWTAGVANLRAKVALEEIRVKDSE